MNNQKHRVFLLRVFFISVIIFYVLKWGGHHWIKSFYDHQSFDILNALTDVQSPNSLDYYVGRINTKFYSLSPEKF